MRQSVLAKAQTQLAWAQQPQFEGRAARCWAEGLRLVLVVPAEEG